MMRFARRMIAVGALTALAFGATACSGGGSGDGGSGDGGSGGATGGATLVAGAVEAAEETLAPFTGQMSANPVDEPLAELPPADSSIGFLQCAAPTCALQAEAWTQAVKLMYGQDRLIIVKSGPSAEEAQQALASLIAQKPSVVILSGTDPQTVAPQLAEMDELGIPVVAVGIIDTEGYPAIKAAPTGKGLYELAGQLMADWAIVENGAEPIVFYTTPELNFSATMAEAFQARIDERCDGCEVRTVNIPLSQIGSTAPNTVVNDLRSNPQTKTAIFATQDAATGLPAALDIAGIEVAVNGFAPSPAITGYIQDGSLTAGLAVDPIIAGFMTIDAAARIIIGQPLTADQEAGITSMQMITQQDLQGIDVTNGFIGYPDGVQIFAELWGVA